MIEQRGSEVKWIAHGCIQTSAKDDYVLRLQKTRDELKKVVEKFKPDCVAMEDLFFQTNAKTAIKVGMARGVALITLADLGLEVVDVTPSQVKQGIAGWGKADKKQVQGMVMRFLSLKEAPKPDDAADALAIAIVGGTMFRQPRGK